VEYGLNSGNLAYHEHSNLEFLGSDTPPGGV